MIVFFLSGVRLKSSLVEFPDALYSKTNRIKSTYCIGDSSISFLDFLILHRDVFSIVLQFSTFRKLLNKYPYAPLETIHPSGNKKALFLE